MEIKGMSCERIIVQWEDTPRGIVLEFVDIKKSESKQNFGKNIPV